MPSSATGCALRSRRRRQTPGCARGVIPRRTAPSRPSVRIRERHTGTNQPTETVVAGWPDSHKPIDNRTHGRTRSGRNTPPPCSPLPEMYPDGPVRPSRRWLQYRRTMARLRRRRLGHLRLNWSLLRRRSSPRSRGVPATGSWGATHLGGCRTGRGCDHTSEPARGAVQGALR